MTSYPTDPFWQDMLKEQEKIRHQREHDRNLRKYLGLLRYLAYRWRLFWRMEK